MRNSLLMTFFMVSTILINTAFSQPDPNFYNSWADTLELYVNEQAMVNYSALKQNHSTLDSFVSQLGQLDRSKFDQWLENDKIALWLNAYNALTLKAIIDHYPIQPDLFASLIFPENSIRQIPGVWDHVQFNIMGQAMSLDQIEHKTLRTQFNEPRVHMALVCASVGCPPLRNEPYTGEKLSSQLDDQSNRFLSNQQKFQIDRAKQTVYLSPIFDWFGSDFESKYAPPVNIQRQNRKVSAVLNFIAAHVDKADGDYLRSGEFYVRYLSYDWSLNEQKN